MEKSSLGVIDIQTEVSYWLMSGTEEVRNRHLAGLHPLYLLKMFYLLQPECSDTLRGHGAEA